MKVSPLDSLPEALRSSKTAQSLLVYLPVCWIVLQVVDLFVMQLGLPRWVFKGTLILLSLGLLVVLFAARSAARAASGEGSEAAPTRRFTRRRVALGGVAVLAAWGAVAALYMGARASGIGPMATLVSRGAVSRSDQVLVADFVNRTRDPGLGQTVAQALAVDLAQSRVMRVVDQRDAAAALKRMDRPAATPLTPQLARELAAREGIEAVVEGSVSSLGSATVVNCRLVSARTGEVLAELHETAKGPEGLLEAVDRVSGGLRNKIGESLKVLRAEPPLAQVTTPSLEALRLYTQAARAVDLAGDEEKGVALLRQALDIDPAFASAWWKLGTALQHLQNRPAQARAAFTQAYAHRERMTERERGHLLGTYHRFVAHDLRASVAAYEALVAAYPGDAIALRSLGSAYMAIGDFKRAEALTRRALALDDSTPQTHRMLVQHLANQGRFQEAETVFAGARRRFPDAPSVQEIGFYLALAERDFAKAQERALQFRASKPADPFVASTGAAFAGMAAAAQGRLDEAERLYRESASIDEGEGLAANAALSLLYVADLEVLKGRPDRAREVLHETLTRFPPSKMEAAERPYWYLAESFAKAGDAGQARRFLKLAREERLMEPFWSHGFAARVDGLIAAAEGRPAQAAARLASAVGGECEICSLYELGLAQEAAGQPAAALAAYERYVSVPSVYRDYWLGAAYERLAALYASQGENSRAELYAGRLAALWTAADPGLRPRVQSTLGMARRSPTQGA